MKYLKRYKGIVESNELNNLFNEITFGDYLSEVENVSNLDDNVFIELQNYFKEIAFDITYENVKEFAAISEEFKDLLNIDFTLNKVLFEVFVGQIKDDYFLVVINKDYFSKEYICDGLDGLFDLFNKVLVNKDYLNWK